MRNNNWKQNYLNIDHEDTQIFREESSKELIKYALSFVLRHRAFIIFTRSQP